MLRYSSNEHQPPNPAGVSGAEWSPAYLPDGYSLAAASADGDIAAAMYSDTDGGQISLIYTTGGGSVAINNEGVIFGEKTVDGIKYDLYAAVDGDKSNSVVWERDGYRFQISSELSLKELWKVAASVKLE